MERLQKFLARSGVASRRQCEELIAGGKVRVNGRIITEMGVLIDPEGDKVFLEKKRILPPKQNLYYLLNKPAEVMSTCKDPQGRTTVIDLLPVKERLYPVGRLDYRTEGLLLLTNDGALAAKLMHPRYKIAKTYRVEVDGQLDQEMMEKLKRGIPLEDGMTQPAKVRLDFSCPEISRFHLTITEGRNRQVRRMCAFLGLNVTALCRVQMGFLKLEGLAPGQYRKLSPEEVERLKKL
ncbi:MAG: pseudouridine synthase [Peptococcaceae bacterium]|nr:pseudouridine synthase [Peptococcaceae bacterium]